MLRDTCEGSEELVTLLLNTTYDEVEENEDEWSKLAESLGLSQMDYNLVVGPQLSCLPFALKMSFHLLMLTIFLCF